MTSFAISLILVSQSIFGFTHAFSLPTQRIQSFRSLYPKSVQIYRWETANYHSSLLPSHEIFKSFIQTQSSSRIRLDKRSLDMDTVNASIQTNNATALIGLSATIVLASLVLIFSLDNLSVPNIEDISVAITSFFDDPKSSMEQVVNSVQAMGPIGLLYFGFVYTIAEILAFPAIPLTASAGYLFGVVQGTSVVLFSASIAAAFSFMIGRTFLRTYVEKALQNYPEFKRIDKVIGQEGFKLMLLLRLSPIFPFALSNYLYGVTSVKFWPYFWGTVFGFLPGTIAYVYTGQVGAQISLGEMSEPWYIYAGGLVIFAIFLKFIADTANGLIRKIEESNDTND